MENKNDFTGFVNLYKPIGITSNAALTIFRKKTKVKKSGFVGTLDPFACGVLAIGCGKATKEIESKLSQTKEYIATAQFGIETDTLDLDGNVVYKNDKFCKLDELTSKIKLQFLGNLKQTPPVYSAKKFKGKRLCDLARKGEIENLEEIAKSKEKIINIYNFDVINYNEEKKQITFKVECSKGTYIRSLISDLAKSLNCLCHLIFLERTRVAEFKVEESIKIDDLSEETIINIK